MRVYFSPPDPVGKNIEDKGISLIYENYALKMQWACRAWEKEMDAQPNGFIKVESTDNGEGVKLIVQGFTDDLEVKIRASLMLMSKTFVHRLRRGALPDFGD